ncbi:MAG: NAD(P)H-dependent oxidoreductase subunit E, partial [Candidatus Hodarchaeota archaeon]
MRIKSIDDLERLRKSILMKRDPDKKCITVCAGTGCRASGSEVVITAFKEEIKKKGLEDELEIRATGCHGFCERGPIVVINPQGIFYPLIDTEHVPKIIDRTIIKGEIIEDLLYSDPLTGEKIVYEKDIPFYKRQQRLVLGNNGNIDPAEIDDYLAINGYSALIKVFTEMSPAAVIDEVKNSGLRGRGGAGFPAGLKWEISRKTKGDIKYVVCNADEGDPGAYMDRSVLEGNPHSVLEGMLIGAYAIGAREGFVYVRNEYPLAVNNLAIALSQAKDYGLLGKNILGFDFDFDVGIIRGAGAFVCGEETALMASIEGRKGVPKQRPPFPAQKGIWGKPTNINNVETWANVPLIISNGASWYSKLGTDSSKGTKIFSLVGKINNTGLVEVPMGTTLKQIIFGIGGGLPDGKQLKAVQIGGPSGGCIPKDLIEVSIDYDALKQLGSMMGSGGMVVMD